MIQFNRVPKYTASNGEQFDSLAEAQQHELVELLNPDASALASVTEIANVLIANADKVVSILKQTPRVRASAKRNGGRKQRRTVTVEAKP